MAERDFSEIAKLSERYNKEPKSRIFVQLADAYRKNNMIDEALDVLHKGLEYHPHYALAHLILGKCYFDKRMYVQAEEWFKKTLSIDSQNLVAYRMLAQTCELTKNEEGQIAAYKGILAIDPLDTVTKEKLDHIASQQKREPLYTVTMAQEYENQGDIVKALSIYEQLLFTDPSDLLLQQKVKVLRERLAKEQEPEPTPPATPEVFPEQEPQPPRPDESESLRETRLVSSFEKEEPEQKEDQVLPLEEFLIETDERSEQEEPAVIQELETTPEESIATPEEATVEPQPFETPGQPLPEVREEKEEPRHEEEEKEPAPLPLEIETAAFHEPPEQAEERVTEEPIESGTELEQEIPTLPEAEKAEESPEYGEKSVPPEAEKAEESPAYEEKPVPPEAEKAEESPEYEEKPVPPEAEKAEESPEYEEKPASPEAEKAEEKDETTKPKEEDFQSFKDWLSGLLK